MLTLHIRTLQRRQILPVAGSLPTNTALTTTTTIITITITLTSH